MKTEHTPGPWTIPTAPSLHHEHSIDIVGENVHIVTIHGIGDREERNANAYLIAAAPEMLDALNEAEDALSWYSDEDTKVANAALAIIRPLLSRLTGKDIAKLRSGSGIIKLAA